MAVAWLALNAAYDVFTISLVATCVGFAMLLVWLAISVPITWIFASPHVTFGLATLQCGHQPAVATNFAAGYRYTLPGDDDYGPNLFAKIYYCSAGDAEAAGYHRP